ncbi:DUF2929 family protein [Gracilibacillus sp. YIM 98692]|uniref:DUF2929 family protein n=1 Tax=Gracilibacillus sp. YIM 98692 TaxID=2663532 RepID=UPI0013D811A5|nr:DUF2929 family protein [Gracilibacillus sp. YIM 98692]
MKYLMAIIWAVLFSFLVAYVLSSMAGEMFSVPSVLSIAAVFTIIVIILGDGILKEEN